MNLKEIAGDKRLPAQEIHKFRKFEYVEKRFGLKVKEKDDSEEQKQGLQELFGMFLLASFLRFPHCNTIPDDLVYRLSVPRVNSISRKSVGVWDENEKAVKLVEKVQRHFIDHSANGFDYLHYCHALYAFETVGFFLCYELLQ